MITAIRVNNEFLTVPTGTIPTFRDSSQLFNYEGVPGKWTLPFTIPYKENAVKLGYPAEPTVISDSIELPCTLIVNEAWTVPGTLVVLKASEASIEISVGAPYYDLSEDLFNTNIKELDWEPVQMSAADVVVTITILITDLVDATDTITINTGYAIYTHNRVLGEGDTTITSAFRDYINADIELSGIHADNPGGDRIILTQVAVGGINRVFDTSLVEVTSVGPTISFTYDFVTWLTDWNDELTEYLQDNKDEYYPDFDFTFPMHYNPDHYSGRNDDFTGWINAFDGNIVHINYSTSEAFVSNKYTLVPMVFFLTVLKKIFTQSNIELIIADDMLAIFKRLVIDNNYSIAKEYYDPIDDIEYLSYDDRVYIPNHLPSMTVGECTNAFRQKFNIYFDYNPLVRTVELKYRDTTISNPTRKNWMHKKWRDLPVFEFQRVKGIRFTSPQDGSDSESGKYFTIDDAAILQQEDYVIGDGELEINSAFSHPSMATQTHPFNLLPQRFPTKLQTGSGEEWGGRGSNFSPRLLIYYGTDYSEGLYPFSSNDNFGYLGDAIPDMPISLVWKDTYALFWPQWSAFLLSTSQCRVVLLLTEEDLIEFDFFTWIGFLNAYWIVDTWEIVDATKGGIYVELLLVKSSSISI